MRPFAAPVARIAGLLGLILGLGGAVVLMPHWLPDRTCHGMPDRGPRDGALMLAMNLAIPPGEWLALTAHLQRQAAMHWLSFRDIRFLVAGNRQALSLCDDAGVLIRVTPDPGSLAVPGPARGVAVAVYERRPSSGWQGHACWLAQSLEARWPGRLRIPGPAGSVGAVPMGLCP